MKITEKDLEKINGLQKKYKSLKDITTEEIVNTYLSRCENCRELCFTVDLLPVPNWKGIVYKVCENCSKELLEEDKPEVAIVVRDSMAVSFINVARLLLSF